MGPPALPDTSLSSLFLGVRGSWEPQWRPFALLWAILVPPGPIPAPFVLRSLPALPLSAVSPRGPCWLFLAPVS